MIGKLPAKVNFNTSRFCTSFTTWFVLPEQGMTDLEILIRGSAFLVKAKSPNFERKFHLITSSHVVAPWKWKNLYKDEFLQFINQKNTLFTAELRHADGSMLTQVECFNRAYHHPERDIAVLHIQEEEVAVKTLLGLGLKLVNLVGRPDKGTVRLLFL